MKRIQMCKKINRNNNSFNHINRKSSHLNSVSPEILVGQIWLQEEEPTACEIIELNTSDEFDPPPNDAQNKSLEHPWSYANNETLQQIEDDYKINKKARERRRINNENRFPTTNTSSNNNFKNNNYYSDMIGNQYIEENKLINHQVNCFTIINKHFINSDTSSEGDFADVEIITSNDIIMDPSNCNTRNYPYNEEIITYDPELDKETRTIWIYSFKNKHLLREDDYELNTAARDMSSSSTSCSVESDEELSKDKNTSVRRLGSPIPPTYIPRLNLSLAPTLSTVTEVSEPNKQTSPNESFKSPKNTFHRTKNSWFMNETESARSVRKLEKSTNIVNWMALSPREKRRRSKELGDKWEGSLLKLETLPSEEVVDSNHHQTPEKLEKENSIRLRVDVDVHVSVNDHTPDRRSLGTPNSASVIVKSNIEDASKINKIKHAIANIDTKPCAQDRGDMKFDQGQQVLCLGSIETLNIPKPIIFTNEPLPKVNSADWEREVNEEKETASYDYITNKLECVPDAEELWMKNNMPLLRPSEWSEYVPIAETPLSIHLSIATLAEERKPWFKRFINIIKCCK